MIQRIDVTSRDNNFYLVRVILATRVIFGHAFVLAGATATAGENYFQGFYGSLGVNGFFVVSGYLVTQSLLSSKSLTEYVVARVLRIIPALWVMLLITTPLVLVFGSGGTGFSLETARSATLYLARNMVILPVTYDIGGVFEQMPNEAVNGSIWSLRFEVLCYVVLGGLAYLGITRQRLMIIFFEVFLIAGYLVVGDDPQYNFFVRGFFRLGALFFLGAAIALYAERVFVSVPLAILLLICSAVVGYYFDIPQIIYFPFGYLIICIAYSKAGFLRATTELVKFNQFGRPDLSYGIFLYSFPIQQLLYYNNITTNPYANMITTLVLAGICAYLSSQLIEKPTARLRKALPFNAMRAASRT